MSALLAASAVFVPLISAVACLLFRSRPSLQYAASLLGAFWLVVCGLLLIQAAAAGQPALSAFGNWDRPFAIVFRVDMAGALLILITGVMGTASIAFMSSDADSPPPHPLLHPMIHFLLMGVGGAFATADLFNMYVWFEVMLMAAVGILALGGRVHQLDAAFKYLVLNIMGTLLLLAAVALIYGATGHLNFSALQSANPALHPSLKTLLLALLGIAFLVKAGAFPFFAWLPASYHTLPGPVLALFAGLLTKVGVYAILRLYGGVFVPAPALLTEALGWTAVLTMVVGVLGAAYHWDIRRILAFHIISQIGYILLGVALATEAGNKAAIFYTIHHIVVKANLFLIGALIARLTGSYDLRLGGGLYKARPLLAIVFLIPALSLVGIPPLSGFWAKLLILAEAVAQGRIVWTFAALLVSVLTLYSMVKIWMEAFWKPHPQTAWKQFECDQSAAYGVCIALALFTAWVGLNPGALAWYSEIAAAQLGGTP